MLINTGSHCTGVDIIVPVIVLIIAFSYESISFTRAELIQTGTQFSATEQVRVIADILNV